MVDLPNFERGRLRKRDEQPSGACGGFLIGVRERLQECLGEFVGRVALLQQRAVLILREVLEFPASEVARMLGTTTPAVKSALQRARARLQEVAPAAGQVTEPAEPQARALLERYIAAFENSDPVALEELLRQDATLEITPSPTWFVGGNAIACAVAGLGSPGDWRMIPTLANGQPAAAAYRRGSDNIHHAYGIVVLTVTATGISRIVVFGDPGLFARFGLPPAHPAATAEVAAALSSRECHLPATPGFWQGRGFEPALTALEGVAVCRSDLALQAKHSAWGRGNAGLSACNGVYTMRMARVNITLPDDLLSQARAAGLNVSRLAAAALAEELDRRAKLNELDAYLADLDNELGPVPQHELKAAREWADAIVPAGRDGTGQARSA
jgi:hypothetical protein